MNQYTDDWYGLYRERWGDDIVPDAYAHPAKFARGLIRRIYAHLIENGYVKAGDTVLDPFGGVALGALDAQRNGLIWISSELEQKFVDLGQQNLELWEKQYRPLWPETWGQAVLLQGDSRELGTILGGQIEGLISSPPYIGSVNQSDKANDAEARIDRKAVAGIDTEKAVNIGGPNSVLRQAQVYGTADGQLGAMAEGVHAEALISSPPYVNSDQNYAAGWSRVDNDKLQPGHKLENTRQGQASYGESEGQLGKMPEGNPANALVSSPPYEGQISKSAGGTLRCSSGPMGGDPKNWTCNRTKAQLQEDRSRAIYSESTANIGNDTGDDFWSAARKIVDECHALLCPGAVAVWVVKRFVRNKEIIAFPDQWRQMCEAAGFETVEWIRAWLVEEHGEQLDLFGNGHAIKVERKSFFRRLYESKYPENNIDWEDVLIMRKRARMQT